MPKWYDSSRSEPQTAFVYRRGVIKEIQLYEFIGNNSTGGLSRIWKATLTFTDDKKRNVSYDFANNFFSCEPEEMLGKEVVIFHSSYKDPSDMTIRSTEMCFGEDWDNNIKNNFSCIIDDIEELRSASDKYWTTDINEES